MGLAEFRRSQFAEARPGSATRLTVLVKAPAERHELSVGKLEAWLTGGASSPREKLQKDRLKQILSLANRCVDHHVKSH